MTAFEVEVNRETQTSGSGFGRGPDRPGGGRGGGGFDDWLFDKAIRQAEAAGLDVPQGFRRRLRELIDEGLARNSESPGVEEKAEFAVTKLMRAVIGIARERSEPVARPEVLEAALSSLCPLWPIC